MSVQSPQLRTAAPYLSLDLMHIICEWLSVRDIYHLALTSRDLWAIANACLWRHVSCVDKVVNLMLVPIQETVSTPYECYRQLLGLIPF